MFSSTDKTYNVRLSTSGHESAKKRGSKRLRPIAQITYVTYTYIYKYTLSKNPSISYENLLQFIAL